MEMQSGKVGLAMLSSLSLITICQWGIRQSTELENQMISVERIIEYAELPSEPALESDKKNAPPTGWPSHGNIEFKALSLRYVEHGARILRDMTFRIQAKVNSMHQYIFSTNLLDLYKTGESRCGWSYWSR